MGRFLSSTWISEQTSGSARDVANGIYHPYIPDELSTLCLAVDGHLSRQAAQVERRIRRLERGNAEPLAMLARFLTRSEAIASSRIEGVAPSAQQTALAELAQEESVKGLSE